MPYERTIRQRPLQNPGRSVWRYMPTERFEDMVTREKLFFTRLRHMMDVVDPLEGQLADINFKSPEVNVDWFLREVLAPGQPPETVESVRRQFFDPDQLRRM